MHIDLSAMHTISLPYVMCSKQDTLARQRQKDAKGRANLSGNRATGAGKQRGPEPPQMQFGDLDFSSDEADSSDED